MSVMSVSAASVPVAVAMAAGAFVLATPAFAATLTLMPPRVEFKFDFSAILASRLAP